VFYRYSGQFSLRRHLNLISYIKSEDSDSEINHVNSLNEVTCLEAILLFYDYLAPSDVATFFEVSLSSLFIHTSLKVISSN
jgi:hypothetical protein